MPALGQVPWIELKGESHRDRLQLERQTPVSTIVSQRHGVEANEALPGDVIFQDPVQACVVEDLIRIRYAFLPGLGVWAEHVSAVWRHSFPDFALEVGLALQTQADDA